MIYIIIMVLASVAVYPIRFKNRKNYNIKNKLLSNILITISFLIALFPMGFRYGIGTDYFYTYYPHFFGIANGTMEFSEVGFNLLNKVIYDLTGDYRVLFFVTSFLFLYFLYRGIYENSDNIFISVLLIFLIQPYFYAMNMVRQAIAIAIIFYAFKYIKENKKIAFCICCIIASLIHSSAIFMIPLMFLKNIKVSNKKRIIIIGILMTLKPIFAILVKYIIMKTQYAWYYESRFNNGITSNLLIIVNIVIFILNMIYTCKRYNEKDSEYEILTNINFISLCILILSSDIPLINRLVRYFSIFQILLLPKIFKQENDTKSRIIIKCVILGMLFAVMYYQIIILKGEQVFPYKSIFNI